MRTILVISQHPRELVKKLKCYQSITVDLGNILEYNSTNGRSVIFYLVNNVMDFNIRLKGIKFHMIIDDGTSDIYNDVANENRLKRWVNKFIDVVGTRYINNKNTNNIIEIVEKEMRDY